MTPKQIHIPVRLDAKTFKRFSRFDTFRLRRRWVRPAVFALILAAFAAIALVSRRPQAGLIAAVLLAVGLGLPLVYFGTYFSQLNAQAERQKLSPARRVYDVTLDFDGVRVENVQVKESPQALRWDDVWSAWRVKGCVYLYASPTRAYLLPDGQADAGDDALWSAITSHMGARCHDLRQGR